MQNAIAFTTVTPAWASFALYEEAVRDAKAAREEFAKLRQAIAALADKHERYSKIRLADAAHTHLMFASEIRALLERADA